MIVERQWAYLLPEARNHIPSLFNTSKLAK